LRRLSKKVFLVLIFSIVLPVTSFASEQYEPGYTEIFRPRNEEHTLNGNFGLQLFFKKDTLPFFHVDIQMGIAGPLTAGIGLGYYNDFGAGYNYDALEVVGTLSYYFIERFEGPFVQGTGGLFFRDIDTIVGASAVNSETTLGTAGLYVGWTYFIFNEDFNFNSTLAVGGQGFVGTGKNSVAVSAILRVGSVFF